MKNLWNRALGRRLFFKGAAATALATGQLARGQEPVAPQRPSGATPAPSPEALARETEPVSTSVEVLTADRPGSDFMLDVLKSLDFEYIAANPGSSFRALHESVINYGSNKSPELLTCCHEESSVALADGYARVEGKPMAVMAHSTVGLQHAAMAIYNSFSARVPVFIILGNTIDADARRPGIEWFHSAQDAVAMVREYTKWDDLPISLPHFAESAVRGYKIAMTPPMGPVVIVADTDLQERPVPKDASLRIPKLTLSAPLTGDSGTVGEIAKLLVNAVNPVLLTDRTVRTELAMKQLVELAELVQAAVIGGRFPTRHPLNQTGRRDLIASADVIVGLDVTDLWGTVNSFRDQLVRNYRRVANPGAKLVSISTGDFGIKSNYQYFQRYTEVDISLAADWEATLPSLIEACRKLITSDRQRAMTERGKQLAEAQQRALERTKIDATYAWNDSPISIARLYAELWVQIKDKDWSLVGGTPSRLWDVTKNYQVVAGGGTSGIGAGGIGYLAPCSIGAALANRKHGRLSVSIQPDGDLMYAPGVLWTAAHHRIPLLSVMHNNRAYHQEVMHIQRMANRHQRGITNAALGTTLTDPNIDFAGLARSLGIHSEGPITDPKDLSGALQRAVAIAQRGEPVLVDVVTQPR